jgi:hypothetical protein
MLKAGRADEVLMSTTIGARRAGGYADRRYRDGLKNWRSRTRLLSAAFFSPMILLGIAGLFAHTHALVWLAGCLAGAGATAWGVVRDSPPEYVEHWREGAEGERRTERALGALGPGWLVAHDVEARYGNYDHIIVGPAGVFLLDTKKPSGTVTICDGVPYVRRRMDGERAVRDVSMRTRVLAAAASLKEDIQRRSGRRLWVQAVVVIWGDFLPVVHEDEQCVFIHGPRLADWIEAQPNKLSASAAASVASAVEAIAAGKPSQQAMRPVTV